MSKYESVTTFQITEFVQSRHSLYWWVTVMLNGPSLKLVLWLEQRPDLSFGRNQIWQI